MKPLKPILITAFTFVLLGAPLLFGNPVQCETPPKPELFAPGIISTSGYELDAAFSPDGQTFYFTQSAMVVMVYQFTLVSSRLQKGVWSKPVPVEFSGKYSDRDPFISPDGSKLFFSSNRPLDGGSATKDDDIWMVEKRGDGWSAPINIGPPVNDKKVQRHATVTRSGNLYFTNMRDIYRSRYENDRYMEAEKLGEAINGVNLECDPWIAPDESYMIYVQTYFNGAGDDDLYISYNINGQWTPAEPIEAVNTRSHESSPCVSPDGKYLYFTSLRKGTGDIYRIEMKYILKPKGM